MAQKYPSAQIIGSSPSLISRYMVTWLASRRHTRLTLPDGEILLIYTVFPVVDHMAYHFSCSHVLIYGRNARCLASNHHFCSSTPRLICSMHWISFWDQLCMPSTILGSHIPTRFPNVGLCHLYLWSCTDAGVSLSSPAFHPASNMTLCWAVRSGCNTLPLTPGFSWIYNHSFDFYILPSTPIQPLSATLLGLFVLSS